MKDAHVTRVGKRSIEGWVSQRGDGYPSHDTKLFFDIRVDPPFDSMRGWVRDKLRDGPLDELVRRPDGRVPALRPPAARARSCR